jgi:hypothetical protein
LAIIREEKVVGGEQDGDADLSVVDGVHKLVRNATQDPKPRAVID